MPVKKDEPSNRKVKIAVVEDHAIVRQGLVRLIQDEPDFSVCGEAADGHEALKLIGETKPDIAIIDLGLQEMSGLELIKNIKIRHPRLPILVVSMHDEAVFAERVLRAGAKGYIMKKESAEKVVGAVRRVLSGKTYLSEKMAEKMLNKISDGGSAKSGSPVDTLSDRELEVFQLIGKGLKSPEIAEELHLSVRTVESYRDQIKAKLNLENASELAKYAIQWVHSERIN